MTEMTVVGILWYPGCQANQSTVYSHTQPFTLVVGLDLEQICLICSAAWDNEMYP